jgi:lysozyme family protein
VSFFEAAFAAVVGIEGRYSTDPQDPGNWTGGAINVGILKGTKYGISARAYPNLDIANLTLDQAKTLYQSDYFEACHCDQMSWERALTVFDCAVNQGQGIARRFSLDFPDTVEFQTQRALRYASSVQFARDGHSWLHRLFLLTKLGQQTPGSP